MDLLFHYDVVCPWAYLASTRVAALAEATGANLVWKPVLLGGLFRHHQAPQRPAEVMSPPRARIGQLDLFRWAERLGVPLDFPPEHPRRSVEAMRLILAAPEEVRPALTADLYRAYWADREDIADRAVLAPIAARHGVDLAKIDDPAVRQALFDVTAEAANRGIWGVPTFVVGDRLWWGIDRMPFVEEALGGRGCVLPPRVEKPKRASRVTFFHDFASPFSYLASTRIQRVAEEHGATVEWVPILLGAMFREIGTPDVPLLSFVDAKQRYYLQDMKDWARHWGVPFRFTSHLPIRTVTPLRVAIVAPETVPAIYRAAWAEDRNIGDENVLAAVLNDAGFDGPALIAQSKDPAVKDALRANTARAEAAGACGVPTFVVDDKVLIWGQDRFDHLSAALSGWRPERG
jgi:2-hydroxychromene-2-carboxylate isomerase